MADTPKKVVRLIDNIKLELYESSRKKYVQIWDPTGNNTYNEGDGGPSGIKSPERSKKYSSADEDDYVIHDVIEYHSQIVGYYYGKSNRSEIKEYFTYLQDPFSETPPPKRIYGGGGLGTPEVDNVGPTPYYLNNGCKVNIKWTGKVPNPDFNKGTFSTPEEAENYNDLLPKASKGPARWLLDKPILSDEDESNVNNNTTLRPQSEWVLENGGYYPGDDNSDAFTYSVGYRDKPVVIDKFVSITLPTGFTENGGKGYLEWVGQGEGKGLVYSTAPKGTISESFGVNSRGEGVGEQVDIKVKGNFSKDAKDKDILDTIIEAYKKQVGKVYIIDYKDYDLKVCFPDTGTCSPIPYKSPLSKEEAPGATPSAIVPVVPLLPKKVKLNVFGLPGVTSLSGETDGTIKVKVKVSLPDFTVYLGDPPGSTGSDASGLNPFGSVEDDVENPDPYEETPFAGSEEQKESGLTVVVWQDQENVSKGQQDSNSNENVSPPGAPVEIKPVSSFVALIDLAGQCARELGKGAKVNAENMKKGYSASLHGLCPQGTQAVLYAMTGVKQLGQISGNADWFSFGPTRPAGSDNKSSFSKTGYYNDKIKITQQNGKDWKGTYLDSSSKSMWQIGDVIAMAYSANDYGHIQVWTGYSWMSDFKQGNFIQQRMVNPNSVALWRMNDKGIAALKKQNSNTKSV
jgi:hypothetical protein